MRKTLIASSFVLLTATSTAAQPPARAKFSGAGLTPYVVAIAGQSADLATTAHNYARGMSESNPLYGRHPSLGKIAAVKAAETAGIVLLMKTFERMGHPKAARVLGYMGGIGGVIPAIINAKAGAR